LLRTLKIAFFAAVACLVAAAGYAAWYVTTPLTVRNLPAEFEIPAGTGFRAAAQRLEEAGVGAGRLQFEVLARALHRAQDIKAGSYEIAAPLTPLELLDKLTRAMSCRPN